MTKVSICIDVPDLSVAAAFYRDALGCSVQKRQASHCTLSAGGVTMQLLLKEAGTPATGDGASVRGYERHWTPVHLDFDVEDLDAAMATVKASGGTVESVQRGDWGGIAICADPFGNGFCLVAIKS
jgi:predicted enzyme related to lactoylglutathione lyase